MWGPDPSFAAGWSKKGRPDAEAEAAEVERQEEHQGEDYDAAKARADAAKARADAAKARSRWGRIRRLLRPGL
jgi:multidrug resistance efflux pump